MFSKLVLRNSKRSQKENALFMSSLIISIMSFYVVLSLQNQDIVRFLMTLEADAVRKLVAMISALYVFSLVILFFLIFYASKYQIDRRSHELGVYLMMGMKRSKLFSMLLTEDLISSGIALITGLPLAILVTELMSLITARIVGIGFLDHQSTFDIKACLITLIGFVSIKLVAFFLISFNLSRKEIGTLLADAPENIRKQKHPVFYCISALIGIIILAGAYALAISGLIWENVNLLSEMMLLGLAGTFMLFYGLRFFIGLIVKKMKNGRLHVFNFRQIEDTVIYKSGTMAVSSLLILAAIICLGVGVGLYNSYNLYVSHVMDYTFRCASNEFELEFMKTADDYREYLKEIGEYDRFSYLEEVRLGIYDDGNSKSEIQKYFFMDSVLDDLNRLDPNGKYHNPDSSAFDSYPYFLRESDYNKLLVQTGQEQIDLKENEVMMYLNDEFVHDGTLELMNEVLKEDKEVTLCGGEYMLKGDVQTTPFTTDYLITIVNALILDDEAFDKIVGDKYTIYLNGIVDPDKYTEGNAIMTLREIDAKLKVLESNGSEVYGSYLNNMGRQLFYLVAGSYVTIYLAIIFFVIANTILGVQFLMNQKKSGSRYRTLVKLGSDHKTLCYCSSKQINWYFGIPVGVAVISSFFGIRSLYNGVLSSRTMSNLPRMMVLSAIVILIMCLVECIYILVVKRASYKYLETLMDPERVE